MRKFQFLLFVLKRSYICYYIICMTVPWQGIESKSSSKFLFDKAKILNKRTALVLNF